MNYEVEVLINVSPIQVDKFLVANVLNEQQAKMMAMDMARNKWGTAKEALSVKQAETGGFRDVKKDDAPIVGKDPGYFFTDTERSSMGFYEILMQIKKGPPLQTESLDIYEYSQTAAEAEAQSESIKKYRGKPGIIVGDIKVLDTKTLKLPPNESSFSEFRDGTGTVLSNYSLYIDTINSTVEFKKIVTNLKKLEELIKKNEITKFIDEVDEVGKTVPNSVSKKLGPTGKALTVIGIIDNLAKIVQWCYECYHETNQKVKENYYKDIGSLVVQTIRAVGTIISDAYGLIDLGYSLISTTVTTVSKKKTEYNETARKAEYDRHQYALKEDDIWYEGEWRMYVNGLTMDEVLAVRETRWNEKNRYGLPESIGPKFDPTLGSGQKVNKQVSGPVPKPAPKTVTVTFNPNGSDKPPSFASKVVTVGDSYGDLPTVTKKGYSFLCWKNAPSGGIGIGPSSTVRIASNHTLYALWYVPSGIKVTFNPNGGNEPKPPIKYAYYGYGYGKLPDCSRSGYALLGWFTQETGGTKVEENTVFTGIQTLYAHWAITSAIKVTFDPAGGTPTPADIAVSSPGNPYGPLPTVTRDKYNFDGWFTAATGGTKIEASSIATYNIKLYAQWTNPNGVTVRFDVNGGKEPNPANKNVTPITPTSTYGSLPTAARDGYTFNGWFTAASGGTKIETSTKIANNNNHTLFAHWTPNKITVAFNVNGGKAPNPASRTVTFDSNYGSLPTAARDGYKLDGWYSAASGGTKVETSTKVANKNTHTLHAHWTIINAPTPQPTPPKPAPAKVVTISFNASGGTPVPASRQVAVGSPLGPLPTVSKAGHTFDGWYNAATGGGKINSSDPISGNYLTFYAQWVGDKVTVTFHRNGAEYSNPPYPPIPQITVTVNGKVTLPTPPVRPGYTFEGWNTRPDGTGSAFNASTPVTANIGVYARWKPVPAKIVAVTFSANGGSAPNPARKEVTAGQACGSLPPATTKAGCVFDGWNTKADGSGTAFNANTPVDAAITVYAKWKGNTYTVTFHRNGAENSNPPYPPIPQIQAAYNSRITLPPPPTRQEYTFEGWNTKADGTGTAFTAGTPVTANIAVYAKWKPVPKKMVAVTFSANGGSAPNPARKELTAGSACGSLPPATTKAGCVFDGWNTKADGSGTAFNANTPVDAAITVYAKWKTNTYTVTFHRNGAENSNPPYPPIPQIQAPYNGRITLPTPPTRPEFTFEGWNTKADGSGTAFTAGTPVTADIAVWAKWKPVPKKIVAVTFSANGGSAPNPARKELTAGSACGSLPPATTKAGCVFDGWNTKPDGSGPAFNANTPVEAAITVYAKWKANTYTVTFHRNGNDVTSGVIQPITTAYNGRITLPTPPVRKEYTFEGWNTKADGSGTAFTAGTPVTADIEVWAKWKPVPPKVVTISFNANGGTPSPASRQVAVGSPIGPLPIVTKAGYVFDGWYNAATGGGKISGTVSISGNYLTFYAYWKANTYTVTFHRNGGTSGAIPQIQAAHNSRITLPPPPTRQDYTFDGWNTKPDGSGTAFTAGTPVTADIAVYAKWKEVPKKVITITFNANGGTPNSSRQVTIGSPIGTLPTVSRSGYRFVGWFNAPSGGGQLAQDGSGTISGNYLTFYAQWTADTPAPQPSPQPRTMTIYFDPNGGNSPSFSNKQVTVGSPIGTLPTVSRSGYRFVGWFNAPSGGGQLAQDGSGTISGNYTTFYAQWTADTPAPQPNTKTVYFDSQGGSAPNPPSKVVTVNGKFGTLPTVTKPGYIFEGWYTPNGNLILHDITYLGHYDKVYAHWRKQ